jgi:hypothetical protein
MSSRLLGVDVADARDCSWASLCSALLYLNAKPSHIGVDVDRLAWYLHYPTDYGEGGGTRDMPLTARVANDRIP